MKSLDNLTLVQIVDKYRDIIGDDFENFICRIIDNPKLNSRFRDAIDAEMIIKTDKKERQNIAYRIVMGVIADDRSKSNNSNDFKRRIIAEIMRSYPDRIKAGTRQEMKKLILRSPIEIFEFRSERYKGINEYQIITEDEPKSIESIYDYKQRQLFKALLNATALTDMKSIIKPKYRDHVLSVVMRNVAMEYFIGYQKMSVQEFKNIYDKDEVVVDIEDRESEEKMIGLLKEYFAENFHLIDKEALLLNIAAKSMLGLRMCEGEKIKNVLLRETDDEEKKEKMEMSIISLRRIYNELKKGKYNGLEHEILDDDGNSIIKITLKDVEEFLSRCTDTRYLTDLYIEKIHENLANGIFPEDLEELRIAGVGLEDITNITKSYEDEENKDRKEELLLSANALIKYLLRNSNIKEEDIIDLYVEGNTSLKLIESMDLEIPKEYFDNRFIELFNEDVYLDTEETNSKLKRYGELYAKLREQEHITTTTDELIERISGIFGEEFVPNIIEELYKTGVVNIEEAIEWLGGEFLAAQYKQEGLQPVEIREMYNKGKINLQELAGMISLLEDNTEKFMIISSLFPEPEAIETRQELSEICLELDEGIKEKGGKKRIKREKADRDYNQYITDPTARFMLIKLLDENYSFKMTLDGHAIMHLPSSNRVLIERMLDKNGKPFYGAATYILDEDCFKRNEDAIVVDNKVKRNKLSQNAESRGVEKLIHSPTGWGKGIKEIFEINEETKSPEELEQIERAIKIVEESRRKIERE